MIYVKDSNGKKIDYEAATILMDDVLREKIHAELAPCDNQEFFNEYCKEHFKKFGEEFRII